MKSKMIRTAINEADSRRRFLRLLAASPVLAASGFSYASRDTIEQIAQGEELITAPEQAVNVLEFEAVARKNLPPAHFGYLATGVDDDGTIQANRDGFSKYQLRVRRLRDGAEIDSPSSCSVRPGTVRLSSHPWVARRRFIPAASLRQPKRRVRKDTCRSYLPIRLCRSNRSTRRVVSRFGISSIRAMTGMSHAD